MIILSTKVQDIHWKNSKEANLQLIIQISIYTLSFIILVLVHSVAGNIPGTYSPLMDVLLLSISISFA